MKMNVRNCFHLSCPGTTDLPIFSNLQACADVPKCSRVGAFRESWNWMRMLKWFMLELCQKNCAKVHEGKWWGRSCQITVKKDSVFHCGRCIWGGSYNWASLWCHSGLLFENIFWIVEAVALIGVLTSLTFFGAQWPPQSSMPSLTKGIHFHLMPACAPKHNTEEPSSCPVHHRINRTLSHSMPWARLGIPHSSCML